MCEIIQRIGEAHHVVIIVHLNPDADSLGSASAMYTYLLTLHKKVSFFCASKKINQKFLFLPWVDKIRETFPSSADLVVSFDCTDKNRLGVELQCDVINIDHHFTNDRFGEFCLEARACMSTTQVLYNLFQAHQIKINAKMATAMYAGLLEASEGFMAEDVNGTTFALIQVFIDSGADYKLCNKFIRKFVTLGAFRLKAIMYTNMLLVHDAKVAVFCVTNEEMRASGAADEDCERILQESLFLPTVEVAFLLRQNVDFTLKGALVSNGKVDVSKIACSLGGGGCANQAAFMLDKVVTLEEKKIEILKLVYKEM